MTTGQYLTVALVAMFMCCFPAAPTTSTAHQDNVPKPTAQNESKAEALIAKLAENTLKQSESIEKLVGAVNESTDNVNRILGKIEESQDRNDKNFDKVLSKLDEVLAKINHNHAHPAAMSMPKSTVPKVAKTKSPVPPPTVVTPAVPSKAGPAYNVLGSWSAARNPTSLSSHLRNVHGHTDLNNLALGQLQYIHDTDHDNGFQPGNGTMPVTNWYRSSSMQSGIVLGNVNIPPPSGVPSSPRRSPTPRRTNPCPGGVCNEPMRVFQPATWFPRIRNRRGR